MDFWNEENLKEALCTAKTYNFPENWSSNGLVIWQDNFKSGNMILARTDGDTKGMVVDRYPEIVEQCSAILTVNSTKYFKYNKPVVELSGNNADALIKMARYIRKAFKGKVVGVTGSSGKSTTTQILVDIFSSKYKTDSNVASKANTTWGIAWNMTRFNIEDDYWLVETSLGGGMSRNSALVKPDYAIITSVAPVHLTNGMTLEGIAEEKSRIFHAMKENSTVFVYSDILHFDMIKKAAEFKNLKLMTFGEKETDDIRIITGDENKFVIDGKTYILGSKKVGKHILLDMAAALGVANAENFDIEDALEVLRDFKTLEGRGEEFDVVLSNGKRIHVTDEAYNANPLSMSVAITAFGEKYQDKNKVLILGDMAECGEESENYHKELAVPVENINPQKIILCGKEIKALYEILKDKYDIKFYENTDVLLSNLEEDLADDDFVMFKSSHSGNLYKIIDKLKNN